MNKKKRQRQRLGQPTRYVEPPQSELGELKAYVNDLKMPIGFKEVLNVLHRLFRLIPEYQKSLLAHEIQRGLNLSRQTVSYSRPRNSPNEISDT